LYNKGKTQHMNKPLAPAFGRRFTPLTQRVEKLEQCYSIKGSEAIAQYSAEEDDIVRQLGELTSLAKQAGNVFYGNALGVPPICPSH
jgi:hypothetical protein